VPRALDHFLTVAVNAQPARFVARSTAQKGAKAWLYQFARRPDTALGRELGAHHGVDIAYVFGNIEKDQGYDRTDRAISNQIMAYWVNFAATGDPNGEGLIKWPPYDAEHDWYLEFSDTVAVKQHLYQEECDFISRMSRYLP